MPRTRPERPSTRKTLKLERLDDRLTPAVGAYDVPTDITGQYPGVVQFGDGIGTEGCTGTLLADGRHILTAAHCITTVRGQPTVPAVGVTVRFDLPEEGGGFQRISIAVPKESIYVHPDWTGDVSKGDDVAILTLPVLAPYGNGSRSIAYTLNTLPGEPNQAFTFVGYGATGTGVTGENTVDARPNDYQRLSIAAGAGSFKLTYGTLETAELPPTATNADIYAALQGIGLDEALVRVLAVEPGDPALFDISLADLTPFPRAIGVVETGPAGKVTTTTFPASDGDSAQIDRLTFDPVAGPTVTVGFEGRTVVLSSSATADEVEATVRTLIEAAGSGVLRVDVDTAGPGVYVVTFRNVDYSILSDRKIPALTATGAGTAEVLVANDVRMVKRSGTNTFVPSATLAGNLDATMTDGVPAGTALLGAGDSGGPAFLNGAVAGIASYGNGNSGFGYMSSWARVSSFLPYIYGVTQLDRTQKTQYLAVLDLNSQPLSAGPHSVEVRQSGGVVKVYVDGTLFFTELASNLTGVKVVGTSDPTTVLHGFYLTVPLTVVNATEVFEPGPTPPVPPSPPPATRQVAVGAGAGGGPRVDVFNPDGSTARSFFAFEPTFTGGVRVAVGDVTGDGVADVVAAAGPGGGPHVAVFDGATGAEVASFFAFEPTVANGLSVAVGDLDGDGVAEIVVGAGPGGGPHVVAFRLVNGSAVQTASFFAFEPGFTGGVTVAADAGRIVVGAGPGGGPVVASFTESGVELGRVFAFAPTFAGGVAVAAGAGVIAVAPGPGGGPAIQLYSLNLTPTATVPTFDPAPEGGLTVALRPSDTGAELYVGPGRGAAGVVRRYHGPDFASFDEVMFAPGFDGGVFVG